jgi:serine/threonine protein kinase
MPDQDHIKRLLTNYSRRLQKLKEQQALEGISIDPKILIEIEDIEAQLKKLAIDLKEIESKTASIPQPDIIASKEVQRKSRRTIAPFTNFISRNLQDDIGFDLSSATAIEIIGHTNHSIVEKCLVGGKHYIIKRTIRDYCDSNAIRHLIGKNLTANEGQVSVQIATPLAVWEIDKYVWELHPFYEGITLREMILTNKHKLKDRILGQSFNALLLGVDRLHDQSVLHRDISPSNILVNGKDDYLRLTLIDCSFCCFENQKQIPIEDPSYSAPELLDGQAVRKSDWYSIAATIYFLGNGIPPDLDDELSFREGLENLDSGNYWLSSSFKLKDDSIFKEELDDLTNLHLYFVRGSYSIALVVESLLKRKVNDRPSHLFEILLKAVSEARHPSPPLYGVLKVGGIGYLTLFAGGFKFLNKQKTIELVNDLDIQGEELQRYVQSLLSEPNA